MSGFYVDFAEDGSVLVPDQVVGRDDADRLINDVEHLLGLMNDLRGNRTLVDTLPPGE